MTQRILVAALALLVAAGVIPPHAWSEEEKRPPDVFVLLIDTLRADHLSTYGYDRPTSPNLDAFAKTATLFTDTRSVVSWTLPAVGTLFTSNYPTAHGLRANNMERKVRSLRPGVVTLTESLKWMDYYTILISANIWLKLEDRTGIERDFDRYETPGNATAAQVNEHARRLINWAENAPAHKSKPLFVYLHYQDPHSPWFAPRLDPSVLGPVTVGPDLPFTPEQAEHHAKWIEFPPFKEERWKKVTHLRDFINAYDETIYAWDQAFGEFVRWLKEKKRFDDAIIVVTADHGEELWDHRGFGHGYSLYEEAVRIPFLFKEPGQTKPRRVESGVNLLDVAPTILAAAGIPKPPTMKGHDVRNGVAPRPLFAEVDACRGDWRSCTQRAVWKGNKKLLLTCAKSCADQRVARIFDLEKDPTEQEQNHVEDEELQKLLRDWQIEVSGLAREFGRSVTGQIDESVSERLRALGYE